jgi:endogenous inhibitor of DNA gyrase (YacG/DUF329 family)
VKDEKARQFDCPSCGAPVAVALASSKSITCSSCHSLIDLTGGIGGELQHASQDEPVQPLIPLGSQGTLQGVVWQVVGFQHRMGVDMGESAEHFGWEEYLLFNAKRGFLFLVDSTEGWSVVKPTTGAPNASKDGQSATYLGTHYAFKESYNAETSYVLGEFYWRVSRGQKTYNREFATGKNLLTKEQSAQEVTWSVGSKIDSSAVVAAFKLEGKKDLLQRSDAMPLSIGGIGPNSWVWVLVILVMVVAMVYTARHSCDPDVESCNSSTRTSGGSYGGFSSGGGHK